MRFLSYANDETDGQTDEPTAFAPDYVRARKEELQNSREKRPRKGRKERRNEGGGDGGEGRMAY